MKGLSPGTHGVLDYITVVVFVVAPTLFGLEGEAAALAYILAAVHLLLTLVTAFAPGLVEVVPFRFHGWIELAVGIVLVVLGFFVFEDAGSIFYIVIGAVILLVWLLTDYRAVPSAGE